MWARILTSGARAIAWWKLLDNRWVLVKKLLATSILNIGSSAWPHTHPVAYYLRPEKVVLNSFNTKMVITLRWQSSSAWTRWIIKAIEQKRTCFLGEFRAGMCDVFLRCFCRKSLCFALYKHPIRLCKNKLTEPTNRTHTLILISRCTTYPSWHPGVNARLQETCILFSATSWTCKLVSIHDTWEMAS